MLVRVSVAVIVAPGTAPPLSSVDISDQGSHRRPGAAACAGKKEDSKNDTQSIGTQTRAHTRK